MKIAVLGGDGFVGWPTSLHLSARGHDIHIIDNLSRRWIDTELGVQTLTPMDSIQERTRIWAGQTGKAIGFHLLDVARDYERLKAWLAEHRPEAIIHFAPLADMSGTVLPAVQRQSSLGDRIWQRAAKSILSPPVLLEEIFEAIRNDPA